MAEQQKLKLRYPKPQKVGHIPTWGQKGDILDTEGISTTVMGSDFKNSHQAGGQMPKIQVPEANLAKEMLNMSPEQVEAFSTIHKALTTNYHAITFFDLFAGIGGFRIGLERLGWRCVGYCEFNKYCVETYKANHSTLGEFYHSDATNIKTEQMPDFDVLVGGFPCQAFSLAGHRKGFEDTRGTLFFEAARIIKDRQPKAFILENVKGLTLMSRNTNKFKSQAKLVLESKEFDRIIEVLRVELGYRVFFKVLNSKNFGVPQNRERVFIVGFRPDIKVDFPGFQYPEGEPTTLRLKDILEPSVPERYYIQGKNVVSTVKGKPNIYPSGYVSGIVSSQEDLSRTLFPGESGGSIPHVEEESKTGIIVAEGKLDGREHNALSTEGVSKTVLDGHGFQIPKIQVVEKGEHQQHNVYGTEGISPSLVRGGGSDTNKRGGGVSQRFAPKIEVIGNYHQPGNTTKQSGDVVSTRGISPTLADAHGEGMPKIQVEGEIYARGGNVLNTEGISETVRAADSQGGRVKIVVEGRVDDYGKHSGGDIISPEGISPTVLAAQKAGHGSQVKIVESPEIDPIGKLQYATGKSHQSGTIYSDKGISPTLTTPGGGHHIPQIEDTTKIVMLDHTKANIKQRIQERDTTWTAGSTHMGVIEKVGEIAPDKGGDKKREQGWSVYSDEGISPTVMAGMGEGGGNVPMLPTPQKRIRRLTPRECLRLQGFPDTFKIVVSDTQAYKQAGNAVTTNVVEAVGRAMERYLK